MRTPTKGDKRLIREWKKKYGLRAAIYFTQGLLRVKRGKYTESVPRIRIIINKLGGKDED